jgi:hypothetical protein
MANRTVKFYFRSKSGYRRPRKRLTDLPGGENFQPFGMKAPKYWR